MTLRHKAEDEALIHSFGHHLDRRTPPLSLASIAAYQNDVRLYAEFVRSRGGTLCPADSTYEEMYISLIEPRRTARTVQRKATALRYFREFTHSIPWSPMPQEHVPQADDRQRHSLPVNIPSGEMPLTALAGEFASLQNNSRTRRAYSSDLRKLTTAFAGRSPGTLSGGDVGAFLEELKGAMKPSSLRRLNATVRAFFNWLAKNGYCERLVVRYVIPEPVTSSGRLTANKLSEAMSRVSWFKFSARDEAIVRLLLLGMTPAEIVALRVEDVGFLHQKITVRSRGRRERFLTIDNALSAALRDCLCESSEPTGEVIRNTRGSALTTRSVGRVVSRFAMRAGLPVTVNPQALRRASAEAAILSGADAVDVKHSLGLAGAAVIRKYL